MKLIIPAQLISFIFVVALTSLISISSNASSLRIHGNSIDRHKLRLDTEYIAVLKSDSSWDTTGSSYEFIRPLVTELDISKHQARSCVCDFVQRHFNFQSRVSKHSHSLLLLPQPSLKASNGVDLSSDLTSLNQASLTEEEVKEKECGMEISNLYNKFRYLSNTKSLQSLLISSSQSVSSISSSKTLIPIINPSSDFSATQNPYTNFNNNGNGNFDSHLIYRNPSLNRSFPTFTSSQGRTSNGNIFFRCFSISNKSLSPTGTYVSRGKSDFGELSRVVVDDKLHTSKRKIGYVKPFVLWEADKEKIAKIVELVKKGEHDMEAELDQIDLNLTHALVREIFRLLNCDGVSGLHFFGWVREAKIDFSRNSDFCSLIIDNLGRLEDFEKMLLMLKDFSRKGLCITENAFSFLRVCSTDGSVRMSSVKHVIDTLKKAGGSSRGSGIHALIKKLCTLNSFDLAVYVMEETTMKTSYYNVLIWAKCGSCKFQEAQELFDEMRRFGCNPNANSYNYILGSLCKNGRIAEACNLLEVMDKSGYLPDAITFEVIIHHAAKLGRLDFAFEFLDQMMSRGIEPRLTTHAAFIKGFFNCDRFQEAYKYVVDMAAKYKCSGNMNYSLLASLHRQEGKLIEAREILVDMIEKGLKPNFSVYIKVMKDLHKSGMRPLVGDLKSRFSKFNSSVQVQ